jgi:hypothetical protein
VSVNSSCCARFWKLLPYLTHLLKPQQVVATLSDLKHSGRKEIPRREANSDEKKTIFVTWLRVDEAIGKRQNRTRSECVTAPRKILHPKKIRAGIGQWYSTELQAGWSGVRVPAGAGNCYLYRRVQTGSEAHPASYPMGTKGSFSGSKAAGARSWSLTSA